MKNNCKAFFKYASGKNNMKCPVCSLEKPECTITKTDQETAEELNRFFSSVFCDEDDSDELMVNQAATHMYGGEVADPFKFQTEN